MLMLSLALLVVFMLLVVLRAAVESANHPRSDDMSIDDRVEHDDYRRHISLPRPNGGKRRVG